MENYSPEFNNHLLSQETKEEEIDWGSELDKTIEYREKLFSTTNTKSKSKEIMDKIADFGQELGAKYGKDTDKYRAYYILSGDNAVDSKKKKEWFKDFDYPKAKDSVVNFIRKLYIDKFGLSDDDVKNLTPLSEKSEWHKKYNKVLKKYREMEADNDYKNVLYTTSWEFSSEVADIYHHNYANKFLLFHILSGSTPENSGKDIELLGCDIPDKEYSIENKINDLYTEWKKRDKK